MSISKKQLALLHVAKAKLKLTEAEYRALLVHVADVTSSTDLDSESFSAVMGMMEHLGFEPLQQSGPDYGARPGMATFAQLELIRQLWTEWADMDRNGGMPAWLRKYWKVESLRFVTKLQAQQIITALKAMKERAA